MGTRGAVGFRIDGQDKLAYNHFDSYPDGLGKDVVEFVRGWLKDGRDKMREAARRLRVVDTNVPPTAADKEALAPHADLGVSNGSLDDWYCLFRKLQGDLDGYLKAGVMPGDGASFVGDSLFCEWAYVVNLDDFTLEVYRGFQKAPHSNGRYASMPIVEEDRRKNGIGTVYHPVALIETFPLDDIGPNWLAQIESHEKDDEE